MLGELDVKKAAMVKYWTTDQQNQVVDRCLQLHGGYGYMEEYPIRCPVVAVVGVPQETEARRSRRP